MGSEEEEEVEEVVVESGGCDATLLQLSATLGDLGRGSLVRLSHVRVA